MSDDPLAPYCPECGAMHCDWNPKRARSIHPTLSHGIHKDWKWICDSCGTLTNDGECDCTGSLDTANCQLLIRNP